MIGTSRPSHQRFPIVAALLWALASCGGSGGGSAAADQVPTIVAAAFVGGGATPVAGDNLLLFFSEDVSVVAGTLVTDTDVVLSGNATLGSSTAVAGTTTARTISLVLGAGAAFAPGTTTIGLAADNDVFRDAAGQFGTSGTPVTITQSDGTAPTMTGITIAAVDPVLNGTGPAGGQLQVPVSGWTIDLQYSDNSTIDTTKTTITASVPVTTAAGVKPAGSNLQPFLTVVSATSSAASYLVPATSPFPAGVFTVRATVVDGSGLGSNELAFTAAVRPFTDQLRPFETNVNAQQVWFLDFTRDLESFLTTPVSGGATVTPQAGPNSLSDFEDILRVLGLNVDPIAVPGGQNSNQAVQDRFKTALLAQLAALYDGVNVSFTLTQPAGSFNGNSSLPYNSFGHSRISIAGSSTSAGVLGIAIFDPSNTTQNDDTQTDFSGQRLGVFLHTIVNAGMGPPSSSAFRQTFDPFTPANGGTPIGAAANDDMRLAGTLVPPDTRSMQIDQAIADLARFTAVVTGHECGHSLGLVENGAMPTGLYGNNPNFPGSSDGHIRTPSLFPTGATNAMSPSLSYSSAVNAASGFNSLNKAYLREQVFYGN